MPVAYIHSQFDEQLAIQHSLFAMGKVVCFSIKTACTVFMQSLNKKAISRIYGRGRGWVFSPNGSVKDFSRDLLLPRLLSEQVAPAVAEVI
jgi:hypothetical protein